MRTNTLIVATLAFAAALSLGGCVTAPEPESDYLIYYDVADAGAIWYWDFSLGWCYLDRPEAWFARRHLHLPPSYHRHDGDGDKRGHHRPPPPPGEKPRPGTKPCYVYYRRDGWMLTSADGTRFNPIHRFAENGDAGRSGAPGLSHRRSDETGNRSSVGNAPKDETHRWRGGGAERNRQPIGGAGAPVTGDRSSDRRSETGRTGMTGGTGSGARATTGSWHGGSSGSTGSSGHWVGGASTGRSPSMSSSGGGGSSSGGAHYSGGSSSSGGNSGGSHSGGGSSGSSHSGGGYSGSAQSSGGGGSSGGSSSGGSSSGGGGQSGGSQSSGGGSSRDDHHR